MTKTQHIFRLLSERGSLTPGQISHLSIGKEWFLSHATACELCKTMAGRGFLVATALLNQRSKWAYAVADGAQLPRHKNPHVSGHRKTLKPVGVDLDDVPRVMRVTGAPVPEPATELERCWGRA